MSSPKRVSFYMEKAVRNTTPLRRKTLNKNLQDNNIDTDSVNNDEEERVRRRSIVETRRSLPASPSLPGTPPTPRSNNVPAAQIQAHFNTCLCLFAQNKINKNNVWNLQVMDYLKTIVNTDMDVTELLQIAGTTVDIGAKIYSVQIDDIHETTIKLANDLAQIRTAIPNVRQNDEEGNEMDDDEMRDNEEQMEENTKKKKKPKQTDSKTRITIVENEESLNAPLPKPLTLLNNMEEGSNSDHLLNIKLPSIKSELLVRDSTSFLWSESSAPITELDFEPSILQPLPQYSVCPKFQNYSLDQWDIDMDHSLNDSINSQEFQYDENGIPLPVIDDIENHDPNDMDMSITEDVGDPFGEHLGPEPIFVTDMDPTVEDVRSKQKVTEFSFRPLPTLNDRIWAGPAHWKWKYVRPQNKENVVGEPGAQKAKKTKKIVKPIDFFKMLSQKELMKQIGLEGKKGKASTRKTMRVNFTLPENMNLPADCCMRLFNNPSISIKSMHSESEELSNLDKTYSYDNPDDNNYCNQTFSRETGSEHDDNGAQDGEASNGSFNNLIQPPELVEQNFVPYARKAKQMNMKKLKNIIWEEITDKKKEGDVTKEVVKDSKLSELYEKLPSKMSQSMAEDLSCPMAFVALLHLANEHNLVLESNDDQTEIFISKD